MQKGKVSKPNIKDDLLQSLMLEADGEDLFGPEGFFQRLKESLANKMLEGEMEHHLGYSKHSRGEKEDLNRRNGHYSKTVISPESSLNVSIPRDRSGEFEPRLIPKGVRRFKGFDDKVISLYARGMTVREIQEHLSEIYGTQVSPDLISEVTGQVLEEVTAWQNRPLESVYPVVYLDCLVIKARDNHTIINKAVYLAIGITLEGHKEVLGLWISRNEGAKFWMQVVTELKNRGVYDILIACVDGLKGFEEAIHSVFPQTTVQLCIVHLVRNSLRFVPWKDRKKVAADLKRIYGSPSQEAALQALKEFQAQWDNQYPTIADMWQRNWPQIAPCLAFPEEIKKAIYTTNAIESINRQIRKIIKTKGVFPDENAIKKSLYLALKNASKKWTMPIRNWTQALNQFAVLFPDRIGV